MAESMLKNVNPPPKLCTGCGLCCNVCPVDAILMTWSEDGFLVPNIDGEKCISCSLCVKKCPALAQRNTAVPVRAPEVWGAWHRSEYVRRNSSSGGIFTALAEWVIQRAGCVFGVVWKDERNAVYVKAETMEELIPMRGSKYTQAQPYTVYRQVKDELSNNRYVLFVGLPCQVAALRIYLGREYEKLIAIDIVCHGVPSRLLLEKYVSECSKLNAKIVCVSFRDKSHGWLGYHVRREYSDGSQSVHGVGDDPYMRMFLSDKILNASCYVCPYCTIPRQGDFTMGDFWGCDKYHPDWPLLTGVSAIILNSDKGKTIFSEISESLEMHPEEWSHLPSGGIKQLPKISVNRQNVLISFTNTSLLQIVEDNCDKFSLGVLTINRRWPIYQLLKKIKRLIVRKFVR